jgi:hypothetical protein
MEPRESRFSSQNPAPAEKDGIASTCTESTEQLLPHTRERTHTHNLCNYMASCHTTVPQLSRTPRWTKQRARITEKPCPMHIQP